MLQPRIALRVPSHVFRATSICLSCRPRPADRASSLRPTDRPFSAAPILWRPVPEESKPTQPAAPPPPNDDDTFVPQPLGRPIGFKSPPRAGDNVFTPQNKKDYSSMSMRERNLEKRKDLVEKWGTNYFRDFKNIRKYRSGKTFMANPRIFKKEAALYFPNLHGESLAAKSADTTPVLQGKISVVNVYSSQWGEAQVRTFTGDKANPALHRILSQYRNLAQMVDINIEENSVKAWIIDLFQFRLRAMRPKEDWGKYFVIKQGVSERIRETIGLLNGRVGYVYLVDQDCKIRWAGSADAEGTELDDLNKGVTKLLGVH